MFANSDVLITRRLTLRRPLDVDAEGIASGLSNLNVARMLGRVPHPYTQKDAEEWLAGLREKPRDCLFTIHREQLVGVIGVDQREKGPTLGYWLSEPYWGRGYMSEAARAVVSFAFRVLDCGAIHSYAFHDNPASLAIMKKLGFEEIGTGSHFCPARGCEVPQIETRLERHVFERLSGHGEAKAVA